MTFNIKPQTLKDWGGSSCGILKMKDREAREGPERPFFSIILQPKPTPIWSTQIWHLLSSPRDVLHKLVAFLSLLGSQQSRGLGCKAHLKEVSFI